MKIEDIKKLLEHVSKGKMQVKSAEFKGGNLVSWEILMDEPLIGQANADLFSNAADFARELLELKERERWIPELAARISASDPLATADPLYCVFQKERVYGIDPDYTETIAWVSVEEDYRIAEGDELAGLEKEYQNTGEREGWRRTGYRDVDKFVTACLSDAGAREYIRINGHNLHSPFVYVETMFRNQEMIDLRNNILASARPLPTPPESDKG